MALYTDNINERISRGSVSNDNNYIFPAYTIPTMFKETCMRMQEKPAMKYLTGSLRTDLRGGNSTYNDTNVWSTMTWTEYDHGASCFAKTLVHNNLQKRDRVCIVGSNHPQWFVANMGTILAGCVPVGIYPTNSKETSVYIVNHSKAKVVVCGGMAFLNKFKNVPISEMNALQSFVLYDVGCKQMCDIERNKFCWRNIQY